MSAYELVIDNAKLEVHCHEESPIMPLSLSDVFIGTDSPPNPSIVTGANNQWTDNSDETYATIIPNGSTPLELNGFAYSELQNYISGDINVTVRLAIKPDEAQPGPGNSTSVTPWFNIVPASELSREGANGWLDQVPQTVSYPELQALVGPQTVTFTYPGDTIAGQSPLYFTVSMNNTTTNSLVIYEVDLEIAS